MGRFRRTRNRPLGKPPNRSPLATTAFLGSNASSSLLEAANAPQAAGPAAAAAPSSAATRRVDGRDPLRHRGRLGFATVLNIEFIVSSGGADLGLGTIRVALTALVLASLGGLVGYFLGHDRLEVRPVWYVAGGVVLAAILDGGYWYLRSSLTGGISGSATIWIGLILALVLAVAITWFLSNAVSRELREPRWLDHRDHGHDRRRETPMTATRRRRPRSPSPATQLILGIRREWNEDTRQFLAVILVAIVALVIGYGVREWATGQTRTITVGSVTAAIPSSWVVQQGSQDLLFTAADPRNPGQRYSVTQPTDLGSDPNTGRERDGGGQVTGALGCTRCSNRGTSTVNGVSVPAVTYTYITTRIGRVPQVIEGWDLFIPASGSVLVVTPREPGARLRGGPRPIQDLRGIGEGVARCRSASTSFGGARSRSAPPSSCSSPRSARSSPAPAQFRAWAARRRHRRQSGGDRPHRCRRHRRQGKAVSASAYGVVVDSSGLVIAPASVVAPRTSGVAVGWQWPFLGYDVSSITGQAGRQHRWHGTGRAVRGAYAGTVLAADGLLDVAIVHLDGVVRPPVRRRRSRPAASTCRRCRSRPRIRGRAPRSRSPPTSRPASSPRRRRHVQGAARDRYRLGRRRSRDEPQRMAQHRTSRRRSRSRAADLDSSGAVVAGHLARRQPV